MPVMIKRKSGEVIPLKNGEYLPAYYFIPQEVLTKCGKELSSIPRYPHLAIRDWVQNEKSILVTNPHGFLHTVPRIG